MDLKNNRELHEMMRTFVILDKDNVLSSDSEPTDLESDTQEYFSSKSGKHAFKQKDRETGLSETEGRTAERQLAETETAERHDRHERQERQEGQERQERQERHERHERHERQSTTAESTAKSASAATKTEASTEHSAKLHSTNPLSFYEDYCTRYMHFTDTNPTTYHAIDFFARLLEEKQFCAVAERDTFDISGGLRFFVTRGGQAMVAVVVGQNWLPEKGIGAVAAHVDALTAKLKPSSLKESVDGFHLLGVAAYSGALNHLWLDRDLGIAGSVLVRDAESGKVSSRLVTSGRHAICRIPSLAPHFGSAAAPLPYNQETKMVPVMGFGGDDAPPSALEKRLPLYGRHSLSLLRYLAQLANCKVEHLCAADLELFDVQPAARGGLQREFMFAPRIDDRLCAFSAVHALVSLSDIDLAQSDSCHVVFLANNEEIGSATRTGAKGKLLNSVVERLVSARNAAASGSASGIPETCGNSNSAYARSLPHTENSVARVFANSVLLSADVTHSLNPNFKEAYLAGHYPLPNTGLTLKKDANGHVMTDLLGVLLMESIASKCGLRIQQFHIRNDMPSGGTIGPMLATDTGARVIDVGLPQLSMHSIRAAAGYKEPGLGIEAFGAFFAHWRLTMDSIDYL